MGLCLVVWAISGLISLLGIYYCTIIYVTNNLNSSIGALCYAEIGTVIPRNGAEVVYMKEG